MHGCDGVGRRQNVFAHKYMWAHLSVCLTPPLKNKKNKKISPPPQLE